MSHNGIVYTMVGPSGSGKSTWLREKRAHVVSADDYFTGQDGIYRFDPSKLGDAHDHCFRRFVDALLAGHEQIGVDNTITTPIEAAPYTLAARAFHYKPLLVFADWDEADVALFANRNVHGVPLQSIEAQCRRLEEWEWSAPVFRNVGMSTFKVK